MSGIAENRRHLLNANFALFLLGFRPFFLLSGIVAVALVAVWIIAYIGGHPLTTYYGALAWHSHEMLFGYTVAVIAGFLLTAVANWTGISTAEGRPLAALATLWASARIVAFFPDSLPHWFITLVDITFLPALAMVLAIPLLRARQRHNLIFLVLLAALATANLLMHLEAFKLAVGTATMGAQLAINLILLLIAIIGGRVMPFFAERALPGVRIKRWLTIERLSLGSLTLLLIVEFILPESALVGVLAVLAAVSHTVRVWGWFTRRVWAVPLLWILYLGYAWMVVGLGLKALAATGFLSPLLAIHSFTVGSIGVLTLGMMARVALGHTGRPLYPTRSMVLAFILINLSACARAIVPMAFPSWYIHLLALSGTLWIAAFSIFLYVYTPILIRPRADTDKQS